MSRIVTRTTPRNTVVNGDCIEVMRAFERGSVDFILTDPPYITRYRSRDGRTAPTTTMPAG